MATRLDELEAAPAQRTWVQWPVYWSSVWVGALAAICTALVIGLAGTAFGIHLARSDTIHHWSKFTIGAVIFGVIGAFFSFVVGGWVTVKVAGILRSETAMLHGAISWLVAVPIITLLSILGAGNAFGWYTGLSSSPAAVAGAPTGIHAEAATSGTIDLDQQARNARNAAVGAATALLLGLVGSVVGGWMASGEPMNFSYYRTRNGQTTPAGVSRW